MPNADKLKGCPFCGGVAQSGCNYGIGGGYVRCDNSECKASPEIFFAATHNKDSSLSLDEARESAITAWNTRPAPRVGDDVVEDTRPDCSAVDVTLSDEHFPNYAPLPGNLLEAMAKAFYASKVSDGKWEHIPQNAKDAYLRCMQAALTAAEAMGYVLTPSERVLPELPEGWHLHDLGETDSGGDFLWTSKIWHEDHDVGIRAWGPTPRAAVLAAIAKLEQRK